MAGQIGNNEIRPQRLGRRGGPANLRGRGGRGRGRGGLRRGARGGRGNNRGANRNLAVANQLVDAEQDRLGELDALVQMALDDASLNGDQPNGNPPNPPGAGPGGGGGGGPGGPPGGPGGGGPPPPPHGPPIIPVRPPGIIKVAHSEDYGELSHEPTPVGVNGFQQWALAHFLAFGYTEKTVASALGQIMKWKNMGKYDLSVEEASRIIYDVYGKRDCRMPFHIKIKAWVNDWLYSWWESRPARIVAGVVGTIALGAVCWKLRKPRHRVALISSIAAVSYVYPRFFKSNIGVRNVKVIQTHCTQMDLLNDHKLDEGASITMPADLSGVKCKPKTLPVGFSFGLPYIWIPSTCVHNELNALVTRQLQPRVPFSVVGENAMRIARRHITGFLPQVSIDVPRQQWMQQFLAKYPLTRRQQIVRSMDRNLIADVRVKGFPKVEVMTGKPVESRKVRFISGFDDGYLAETGPEYYLWQKAMCKALWSNKVTRMANRFVYTGGLLADEIGEWFDRYKDRGYVFLLLDFSKFDSRNKSEVMQHLYKIYENHLSPELFHWLKETFHKFGTTSHGIKFSVEATVASGRIDTSFGNTLIVFMLAVAILYLLDPKYVEQAFISALGDDNNIALPEFNHSIDDIKRVSGHLGHEADGLIVRPTEYHLIEYCSQRCWQVQSNQSVLGPKIGRLLAKTFVCHKHVPERELEAHINGVMQGFKHYRFLPVFRAVYQRWFEKHKGPAKLFYGDSNPYRIQLKEDVKVDMTHVMEQFINVYGFDPTVLEREILQLEFNLGDTYTHPLIDKMLEVDGVSYTYGPADYCEYLNTVTGMGMTLTWWRDSVTNVVSRFI